jgi:AcrR family transcriptional regulator
MTTRGDATRERLLDVAEQMLSSRGVEGVSLREIRIAAGQRNTSALQFHFGDRDGLLKALSDRHRPRLRERMLSLYDAMVAEGRDDDTRSMIEVFIRPNIDYVFEGPSEQAWVRISAELAARPEMRVDDFVANSSPQAMKLGIRLLDALEQVVPRRIGFDRIFMVGLATLHLCADRARMELAGGSGRRQMSQADFTDNAVDMAHGALFAPIREPAR